jgi:hypothetical protein
MHCRPPPTLVAGWLEAHDASLVAEIRADHKRLRQLVPEVCYILSGFHRYGMRLGDALAAELGDVSMEAYDLVGEAVGLHALWELAGLIIDHHPEFNLPTR